MRPEGGAVAGENTALVLDAAGARAEHQDPVGQQQRLVEQGARGLRGVGLQHGDAAGERLALARVERPGAQALPARHVVRGLLDHGLEQLAGLVLAVVHLQQADAQPDRSGLQHGPGSPGFLLRFHGHPLLHTSRHGVRRNRAESKPARQSLARD